jgi:hypothetical protein
VYWGKVAVGEDWHARALQAAGFAASQDAVADGGGALLWKSQSGENANLRWDLPQDQVQYAWQLDEGGPQGEAERALLDLSRGVAGGDSKLNREEYLFDNVDLPRTINNLAAQTVLLNQDRCVSYDLRSFVLLLFLRRFHFLFFLAFFLTNRPPFHPPAQLHQELPHVPRRRLPPVDDASMGSRGGLLHRPRPRRQARARLLHARVRAGPPVEAEKHPGNQPTNQPTN